MTHSSGSPAECCLAGLMGEMIYAPYDLTGIKYLWWTWHDTDAPIAHRLLGVPVGSTVWVITFTASFQVTRGASLVPSILLIAAVCLPDDKGRGQCLEAAGGAGGDEPAEHARHDAADGGAAAGQPRHPGRAQHQVPRRPAVLYCTVLYCTGPSSPCCSSTPLSSATTGAAGRCRRGGWMMFIL